MIIELSKQWLVWQHKSFALFFFHVSSHIDSCKIISYNVLAFPANAWDQVDLESLMMAGQLSILVVGQDILRTNGEVSTC